jgi:hypothetical protein
MNRAGGTAVALTSAYRVIDMSRPSGGPFFSPLEWDTCRWIAILRNKIEHSLKFGGVSV